MECNQDVRRHDGRSLIVIGAMALMCLCRCSARLHADEVQLTNGLTLQGTALKVPGINSAMARRNSGGPVPSASFWLIDDGVRRYFVFRRMVANSQGVADLAGLVTYEMKQERTARTSGFETVGGFTSVQPFDEFGRRTVGLATQRGNTPVIQAITKLRPDYAQIESLTHDWQYAVDTSTIPPEVVTSLIEKTSDQSDPAERKGTILFYVQAEMYAEALREVDRVAQRFPDLKDWCAEYRQQISEFIARKAMNEIERRRAAGQHRLAYRIARDFPAEHVSSDVARRAREVAEEYDQALRDRETALMLLDMLQAELPREQSRRLAAPRAIIQDELHFETLDRLEPLLRTQSDDSLSAGQKLALAYSGWLLGNADATLDLDEALRLWEARFLILEYLRSDRDPLREEETLKKLQALDGFGITQLAKMIPRLPLAFESAIDTNLKPATIELPAVEGETAVRYSVMLPPDYSPAHHYPLLVVLRSENGSFDQEALWWSGNAEHPGWAQRRGYVVVAPHYCDETATRYEADSQAHGIVMQSIAHARKRLRIDSNRIFIAGHGMGGDACFDIAMSHPGVFAGAVPITGKADRYCKAYWSNDPHLGWYIVGGERDRDTLEVNAGVINEMMRHGQDVIYCEYKDRGFESYSEEQERIFEWMQPRRRVPLSELDEWEVSSLRLSDNRFYWMQAGAIPTRFFPPIAWDSAHVRIPHVKTYDGRITPSGAIYVSHPGESTTIWLSPELFDFENRCQVRINLKYEFNDFVKPSMEVLLKDLRERGDRERLYWAKLTF